MENLIRHNDKVMVSKKIHRHCIILISIYSPLDIIQGIEIALYDKKYYGLYVKFILNLFHCN